MFDIISDLLKKNLLTLDSKTTSIILSDTNLKYLFIHWNIQLWSFLDYTLLWKMFSLSLYLILCPPHPFIQGHWVTNGTSKPIPSYHLPCLCLSPAICLPKHWEGQWNNKVFTFWLTFLTVIWKRALSFPWISQFCFLPMAKHHTEWFQLLQVNFPVIALLWWKALEITKIRCTTNWPVLFSSCSLG